MLGNVVPMVAAIPLVQLALADMVHLPRALLAVIVEAHGVSRQVPTARPETLASLLVDLMVTALLPVKVLTCACAGRVVPVVVSGLRVSSDVMVVRVFRFPPSFPPTLGRSSLEGVDVYRWLGRFPGTDRVNGSLDSL